MADDNKNAAGGTIDTEALAKQINTAVASAMKPIVESLAGLPDAIKAAVATKPAEGDKGTDAPTQQLTAADIEKALDAREAKRGESAAAQAKVTAATNSAIEQHLKGVPKAYLSGLPQTDDAAQLKQAADAIRATYQADLASAGVKAPTIGGQPGADARTADKAIDASKLSPVDKIATGYTK